MDPEKERSPGSMGLPSQINPGSPGTPQAMREGRFYGKYRATVLTNWDPEYRGRILAWAPHVPSSLLNWAEPCVPYAGMGVGFWSIPPIGANVWIEYEGGNPSYPIWSGCFWDIGEFLLPATKNPLLPSMVKVWKTAFCTFILDDTPLTGGVTLQVTPLSVPVPVTLQFNARGATIQCGASTWQMTIESIQSTSVTLSQTAAATSSTSAGASVSIKAGANASIEAGAAVAVKAGASAAVQGGATAELSAGLEASLKGGTTAQIAGGTAVTVASLGAVDVSGTAVSIGAPAITFSPI